MSEWQPIETAPMEGIVVQLAVKAERGERCVFVAYQSFDSRIGEWYWLATRLWGFSRLHSAWTPYAWKPLPKPPEE